MALFGRNILIFGLLTVIIVREVNVALCNQHTVQMALRSSKNLRILRITDRKCQNNTESEQEKKGKWKKYENSYKTTETS